jgi:predicted transcriptional regulator
MAELEITAADLAGKAELSPSTITGMLRGKTTPQRTTLRKLSGGLGWPHEHLWCVAIGSPPQASLAP